MRVPMEIKETVNTYLATKGIFLSIYKKNKEGKKINSVIIPSMGTGVGKMPYDISAKQMRVAYEDIILKQEVNPRDFSEAQLKQDYLKTNKYDQTYKKKFKRLF